MSGKSLLFSGTNIKRYFSSLQLYPQVYLKCTLDRSVAFALSFLWTEEHLTQITLHKTDTIIFHG